MKINAYLKVFTIIFLISFSHIYSASFGLLKKNNKKYQNVQTPPVDPAPQEDPKKPVDIPDQPVYFNGWVKYLHYGDSEMRKPKAFFKNGKYDSEKRIPVAQDDPKVDEKGLSIRIPSELHFYVIVYQDTVNFFNSRMQGGISHVIDSLSIDYVNPIPDTDLKNGGIVDYGKFDEGFCFRANTKVPTKQFIQTKDNLEPKDSEYFSLKWVICSDDNETKNKLMDILIKLKLKNQHKKNIYLEYEKPQDAASKSLNKGFTPPKNEGKVGSIFEGGKKPNDCYMVILHEWTPCTLACGGGKSYLQLMKVDAKQGGEECKTKDTILTRDCNAQPCPTQNQVKTLTEKKTQQSAAAVAQNATVKMMAISQRPTRYDKCHLKETDALMEKKDESTKDFTTFPMIPVRLVMNEKTVTAYQDDNLVNKIVTYMLNQSAMIRKDDKKCVIIQNNTRNDKFCMLDSGKGDFVEEWYYDFNLFKNQCRKPRPKSNVIFTEEKRLEEEFKNKVDNIKLELVQNKADMIKKQVGESEKRKLVNKVDEVRKISLNAIEKEMRLEDLLEKEEESREENESLTLEQQIQAEKKKEECLMKAIKEKEIENQYNIARAQAEHAIQQITKNTQAQIAKQRESIAKKIIEMRQKQKRKKAQLKNEIMTIRTQIAERLQKINRVGNEQSCLINTDKERYCGENFADNYMKFTDCMQNDSFCYVCCENEFGELHVVQRDACYNKCDGISVKG